MRLLYLFIFLVLGCCQNQLLAQAQTTLVRSIANNTKQAIVLSFNSPVEVSEWDNDYIRVTTSIQYENFDEGLLKKLVAAGRYSVQQDEQEGKLWLSMPKLEKVVKIQNQELKESIIYQVSVPRGQYFELTTPLAASL